MFTSMTARVSTNTYCLARTRRFSRQSENFLGHVAHEREAPTDAIQLAAERSEASNPGLIRVAQRKWMCSYMGLHQAFGMYIYIYIYIYIYRLGKIIGTPRCGYVITQ